MSDMNDDDINHPNYLAQADNLDALAGKSGVSEFRLAENDTRNLQQEQHNHTIKGEADDVGVIAVNSLNPENSGSNAQQKKREKEREFSRLMLDVQNAYDESLKSLHDYLGQVRSGIKELETYMHDNRAAWDSSVSFISEIDETLETLKHTGEFDREAVIAAYENAGKDIPEGLSDAELALHMQIELQAERDFVEQLDAQYKKQESTHQYLKNEEEETLGIINDFEQANTLQEKKTVLDQHGQKALLKAMIRIDDLKPLEKINQATDLKDESAQDKLTTSDTNHSYGKQTMLNFLKDSGLSAN